MSTSIFQQDGSSNLKAVFHLTLAICGLFASALAQAENWMVDYDQSQLEFTALQENKPISGNFSSYQASIIFNPEDLKNSLFDIIIQTASVDTKATERDDILKSADFFHARRWPEARFFTQEIEHLEGSNYRAQAKLRIRDVERQVIFPFNLVIHQHQGKGILEGNGSLDINRFDYDLAQSDWTDTDLVGEIVSIQVNLKATRKPSGVN